MDMGSRQQFLQRAAAGAAALFICAQAAPAFAEKWYSAADPLTAYDNGIAQAEAHGRAYKEDGYLKNNYFYRDPRPGGDSVYVETKYNFYEQSGGSMQWTYPTGKDQAPRWDNSSWKESRDVFDYSGHGQAQKGRVHTKTCEDQRPLNPDPCSREPFFTFDF